MSFEPASVETVTFDSYSTIVDVDAAEQALADRVPDPEPVSQHWRARSLEYTFVADDVDAYRPFYELNRAALQHALDTFGVDLSPDERDEILSVYHELDVFDDVREGLAALTEAGYDCYVVSNGNPEMLASMVEGAGVSGLVEDTVSADEVRRYKPDPELYRHAAARAGTDVDRICHVSALWFDVQGAANAGMRTAWVNRRGGPPDTFGTDPDLVAADFGEVAEALLE